MTKPLTGKQLQALAVELTALRDFFATDAFRALDPNQILPFKVWIKFAGISAATGWKLLHSDGGGPKFLRIGERRVGVRVADHIKWCDRLARAAA